MDETPRESPDALASPAGAKVNLERRVRRHVQAPSHRWFAPCAPGLEGVLGAEARALGLPGAEEVPGGVEFQGRLEAGYGANLHLRTANRVWLRVGSFAARAPEDVYREARELPWEALLAADVPLRLQATTSRSRLFGGGLLGRPVRDAIGRRLRALGLPEPPWTDDEPADQEGPPGETALPPMPVQRLLARLDANRLELSLDSSGALLHRRGYRLAHGGAPLRETLAAGILSWAGYDGSRPLVDPMCGSGTFAVEAAAIARHLAPGRSRTFLFERWPSARPTTLNHLRRLADAAALPAAPAPIVSRDLDPAMLALATTHASRAGVAGDVAIENADFFEAPSPGGVPGLVVLNPPYGVRLAAGGDPVAFYRKVGRHLATAWKTWRCVVIAPSPAMAAALDLPGSDRLALSNGGLDVLVVRATLS